MRPTKPRPPWLFALKLALSAGLLGWLLSRPEMRGFPRVLQHSQWHWLVPAIVCGGLAVVFSTLRWRWCLHAVGMNLPIGTVFRITLAGNAAGYFSIGSLGNDAARMLLLSRCKENAALPAASSLVMDHLSSLPATVLLFTCALAPLGMFPTLDHGVLPTLVIGTLLIVGLIGFVRWKWKSWAARIEEFLKQPGTWKSYAAACGLSFPVWFSYTGAFYCVARGLGQDLPLLSFIGISAVADAIASLPISIAGLGVREQAFQSLLSIRHSVPAEFAVATSLGGFGIHLLWSLPGAMTLLGRFQRVPNPSTTGS